MDEALFWASLMIFQFTFYELETKTNDNNINYPALDFACAEAKCPGRNGCRFDDLLLVDRLIFYVNIGLLVFSNLVLHGRVRQLQTTNGISSFKFKEQRCRLA